MNKRAHIRALLRRGNVSEANFVAYGGIGLRKRPGTGRDDDVWPPDTVFEIAALPDHWRFFWYRHDPEEDWGGLWIDLAELGEWQWEGLDAKAADRKVKEVAEYLVEEVERVGEFEIDRRELRNRIKQMGGD